MIGIDFPVKPAWIQQIMALWQPKQPIGELIDAALRNAMPELGGEKTRRNSLTIILRAFVPTEGGGRTRRTTSQNVWAAYATAFSEGDLAPAYLAQLIGQSDVAQEATRFMLRRHARGASLTSGDLRRHFLSSYGERKVVLNSASAFLSTLHAFGALTAGTGRHTYFLAEPLAVTGEVFRLIVWAWWGTHGAPQINLASFEEDPAVAFLDAGAFPDLWRLGQPGLWVLEDRIEGKRATLRHPGEAAFANALLAVLDDRHPR